jgi:hypothetical protein
MGKASRRKRTTKNLSAKTEIPLQPERQTSLLESNAVWGSIGIGAALVLTVVAAMVKDLRWLLWIAWLVFWVPVWVVTKRISQPKCEPAYFVLGVIIFGLPLYGTHVSLEPKADTVVLGPQLSVESEEHFYLIPQEKQLFPPKARQYARIKVTNIGGTSVSNVKATVIRVNSQARVLMTLQLPLSSGDNLIAYPNPGPMEIAANLNLGEEQYFDVIIECNGHGECPKGELALLHIDSGRRLFVRHFGAGYARLEEITVRVSSDVAPPVTKTFKILRESNGKLLLKENLETETKEQSHQ